MRSRAFYLEHPENFYAFLKEVLVHGYELLVPKPHAEMCRFIVRPDGKPYRLMAVPRDCFKSTIMRGYIVYDICRHLQMEDMDFSYLIDSANKRLVQAHLRSIKKTFEANQTLIDWFGEFPVKHYWARDDLRIRQQDAYISGTGRNEPTIAVSSVGSEITGMHFKTIIADDWVTGRNIRTPQSIDWGKKHYEEIHAVMDKESGQGKLFITCTFWHPDDVYANIIKNEKEYFDFFIEPIYKDVNGVRELFFPSRYGMTQIEKMRKKSNFYTQYMLQPVPQDHKVFPDKHWNVMRREDMPQMNEIWISYDPADQSKDDAVQSLDFITAAGFDKECRLYVLDAYMQTSMPVENVVKAIIFLCKKYASRLRAINVEKVLFFKYIRETLLKALQAENMQAMIGYLRPLDIDRGTAKKERIKGLEMPWKNGRIIFSDSIPKDVLNEFQEEFATYPKCRYFDGLDALEMISRCLIFPQEEAKKTIDPSKVVFVQNEKGLEKDRQGLPSIKGAALFDWVQDKPFTGIAPVPPIDEKTGKEWRDFVK